MNSVFIETTIPSYYYETRDSPTVIAWRSVTREWWDHYRNEYRLFTSRFVLAELARAPAGKARHTTGLLKSVEVLDEPPGLQDVVEYYLEHKLMPVESGGDAFHLAMASLHSLDFLLTWNCLHLANANKVRHLEILNGRLKLPVPIIPETEA